jgi:hypothetical protein
VERWVSIPTDFHIDLVPGAIAKHARPYPVAMIHLNAFKKELLHLVEMGVISSVIGHGLMLLLSIAKWRDLLNSQLLVYDGDKQTPPDLLNLLPEGTDLDSDKWLMRHKSIPAFPRRNANASSNRRSFGSKRYF